MLRYEKSSLILIHSSTTILRRAFDLAMLVDDRAYNAIVENARICTTRMACLFDGVFRVREYY